MIDRTPSDEFTHFEDKLKRVARLIVEGNNLEAIFLIGCLHTTCLENVDRFKEWECKPHSHE